MKSTITTDIIKVNTGRIFHTLILSW